jgi:hypothetical protein
MLHSPALKRHLRHDTPLQLVVVTAAAAFLAYCSIYGFRKPFTAASFDGREFSGIHYKILLVVAQVAGYALSKFIGIGVIAGLGVQHRARLLMGVALFAEIALLGFATTPYPWNILWMFMNGLPLGMAWGLVFSYLEGRRATDILGISAVRQFHHFIRHIKNDGPVADEQLPCSGGMDAICRRTDLPACSGSLRVASRAHSAALGSRPGQPFGAGHYVETGTKSPV